MVCLRLSNYIYILDLTHGFNGLGRDNCKLKRPTFKYSGLVRIILEFWQQYFFRAHKAECHANHCVLQKQTDHSS